MADATITATIIQATGWGLAVLAWQRIDVQHSPRWIVLDLYASTALLGASGVSYAAALLFGPAELARAIAWIVVGAAVAYIVASGAFLLLNRGFARGPSVVGPLRMETERADVGGWTVRDVEPTPRATYGGYSTVSPTVRSIMNMEVA